MNFIWIKELAQLFSDYEANHSSYLRFDSFMSTIAKFYSEYAKNIDEQIEKINAEKAQKIKEWKEKSPKVVRMIPPNGSKEVGPNLREFVITFDRSMKETFCTIVHPDTIGHPHPEVIGEYKWDNNNRVIRFPVRLKPNTVYPFSLNTYQEDGMKAFHSPNLYHTKYT